jgi:hypothetical protein
MAKRTISQSMPANFVVVHDGHERDGIDDPIRGLSFYLLEEEAIVLWREPTVKLP